jgi:hypothetical protein
MNQLKPIVVRRHLISDHYLGVRPEDKALLRSRSLKILQAKHEKYHQSQSTWNHWEPDELHAGLID